MLKDLLVQNMKEAMKAKEKFRLGVIRMALAEIKRIEIDEQINVDHTRCLAIVDKMVKQRRDAAQLFTEGQRLDLAENELAEVEILKSFLPKPLTASEISVLIDDAIKYTKAADPKSMGVVIKHLKPLIQGKADLGEVSKIVKSRLS